nr:unnamed protein product [Callosobruchus analis]
MKRTQNVAKSLATPLRVTYGLCIPSSCSIGNLQKLWDYMETTFRIPVHLTFRNLLCKRADQKMEIYFHDKCI